ncbi:proprotein convertase P-domain-containing protein [Aureitalea marina]|uniref:P/Homo B domain-containing protein n=1 Tax=Aureitalea marina TaxID=930804 RepID=A0A2S7KN23_9FLAO|nr:proprotein convertase P-domain-containing protein [Aureitalea marina]PQB04025.1 hypothetical protein BST85_03250 [Aureitalea marina]
MRKITLFLSALFVSTIGFAQLSANSTGVAGVTTNLERGGSEILLTHSNDPATIDDGIFCGPANPVALTSFRSYVLTDFGITGDFNVNRIQYGFFALDGVPGSGVDVTVEVWTTDAAFPTGNLTLLASATENVTAADVGLVLETAIDATVPAGSEMVIALRTPNDGLTTFSIGANNAGQTAPSWIQSLDCVGDDGIYDLDADFALSQSWVLNAVGEETEPGISCDSNNYEATGLPIDIDGGDTQTADCANAPNLVPVDVDAIGFVGMDAEIENVEITITHTWVSDLQIFLVSPSGTELLLSANNGGSDDNYVATVFEDGAPSIVGASAPFTGTFSPEGGTFADTFMGENVGGTWNLKVCDGAFGDTGQIVSFEMNVCAQPFNDVCDDAYALSCGDVYAGSTAGATDTAGNDGPDVYFSFTGEGDQEAVTLSLCDGGTGFDSILWVFTDCTLSELVATNDDSCGLQSELTFVSDGFSTYYIVVDGFSGSSSGDFSLEVACGPVTNDFCEGAESISCGETVTGTTDGATADNSELCGGEFNIGNGVWYTFTDDFGFSSDYTVSLCDGGTTYDSQLTVYEGDDCGNLTCVGGNDDFCGLQSEVSFTGDGNSTYYILVHGFGGSTGSYSLSVNCDPIPPPNDDIENAIDVDEIGFPYTDPAVAMPAATTEDGNPVDCNIDGANGVWYKFTATEAGFAEGEIVSPAGFSTVVFFRAPDEDSSEEDLIHIPNGNNQCLPSTTASILTVEGRTYYVFVTNQGGGTDINLDSGILGVEENGIEGFTFSPNPASDVLTLNALDVIERATVYNILGQEVIDRNIDATTGQLNVSSLSVGTYIMKVTVNGQVGTYKIVKQ